MKSSAITPGAICRLPRLEVGLLRAVGVIEMSAFGDDVPSNGECHAGSDILRSVLNGDLLSSWGLDDDGPGTLASSGAISSWSILAPDLNIKL